MTQINAGRVTAGQVRLISSCYAALETPGHRSGLSGRPFELEVAHHSCLHWRNAVMSPIHFPSGTPDASDLAKLEKLHQRSGSLKPYDSKNPYFNLIQGTALSRSKRFAKSLKDQGWSRAYGLVLNQWSKPLPLDLPRGYSLVAGGYFERGLRDRFIEVMQGSFKAGAGFLKELDHGMRPLQDRILAVGLVHRNGNTAGMGLVAFRGEGAYLFCGGIMPRFRGKGLWRALVSARQAVSHSQGALGPGSRPPPIRGSPTKRICLLKWMSFPSPRVDIIRGERPEPGSDPSSGHA